MNATTTTQAALWSVLDKLDTENDDQARADLIDWANELADKCPAAAADWKTYR